MYDLRCDRAQSWIKRAGDARDLDAKFVFLWIAFDSLFGQAEFLGRKSDLNEFLTRAIRLDAGKSLPAGMSPVKAEALVLVRLRYLYPKYREDGPSVALGEVITRNAKKVDQKWAVERPQDCLRMLYRCLYVLRNQVIHGAARATSRMNRDSLGAAVPILSATVPIFRQIVWEHLDDEWGEAPYRPSRHAGEPETSLPAFHTARVISGRVRRDR